MTRRNGRLSPETNGELETIDLTPKRPVHTDLPASKKPTPLAPRMKQVLDASIALANLHMEPTPSRIAIELGEAGDVGTNRVRQTIAKLRARGDWPHGDPKPGRPVGYSPAGRTITPAVVQAGDEIDILGRCVAAIESLDAAGRRRVWRYLADRFGEA